MRALSGAVTLGASQAVRIVLQFASVIMLSRLLTPEDFGITARAAPVVAFLGIFQDFGFQQAIVQRQDISERDLTSIFWTVIGMSLVVLATMAAISPLIAWFFHDSRLIAVSICTALPLLFYAAGSVQNALLNRRGDFAGLAVNDILVACVGLAVAVMGALAGMRYWSLVAGALAAGVVSALYLQVRARWMPGPPALRWPGGGIMQFGSNLTGFTIVNFFARNADNILIGHAWGGLELGFYDRAYKLLLLPLQNIAFPAARVVVPLLSRVQDDKPRLRELYLRATTQVCLATVPGMAAMVATGPHIVPLVFGDAWAGVSPIFVWLGIVGLIQPLGSTIGWIFIAQGNTQSLFRLGMVQAPITILSFLLGLHWGAEGVAVAYAVSSYAIGIPLTYSWVARVGPVRRRDLMAIQFPLLAAAGLTWLASHALADQAELSGVALILITGVLSYLAAVLCLATMPAGRAAIRETMGLLQGVLRMRPAIPPCGTDAPGVGLAWRTARQEFVMHIHIQNLPGMLGEPVTRAEWDDAARRAGLAADRYTVTVGDTEAAFAAAIATADMLVTATKATQALFPADAPKLKLMFCTSAGLDAVPFADLPEGVQVLNNRGTHGPKAGEYGIMALLMLGNHIPAFVTSQRAGEWSRLKATVMTGRAVTIVGLGSLGGAVATHAAQFGMRVTGIRNNPAPHPACERVLPTAALDDVLPGTEFLVLACPLTEQTRNLLDRRRIGLLPKGAGVVNIGRGPLLDQDALCDALEQGAIGGAVLDVFVPEPVPPGHRLWSVPNLIMTPHMSSDDHLSYNARSLDIFIENMHAFERGEPLPNLFDRSRGY